MILVKILVKIVKVEVKNKCLASDIIHCRKRLPVKYLLKYLNDKDVLHAYGNYLVCWELFKYRNKNYKQTTLEDFLDD